LGLGEQPCGIRSPFYTKVPLNVTQMFVGFSIHLFCGRKIRHVNLTHFVAMLRFESHFATYATPDRGHQMDISVVIVNYQELHAVPPFRGIESNSFR
jgi:hypothetical protein